MRVLVLVLLLGCKREASPAPAQRVVIDATIVNDAMPIDAMTLDAAVGAPVDATPIDATPIDAMPIDAPPAKKKVRSAREACLEKCEKRNRYTDCADDDGNMMPCPCHCP